MSTALVAWPMRFLSACGRGLKAAFGPLITKDFWIKVFALCAREMIAAFMKTLGGKLMSYGMSREDPEVKRAAQSPASSAFNYAPSRPDFSSGQNTYQSGFSQRPATSAFPGFNQ